jgi:membrane protease YdiL (CAAX protease family)
MLDLLQWPAMVASVLAAWLVASNHAGKRNAGFWVFLASNVLWVAWGWHTQSWALVALQFALAALNVRGVRKTEKS